MKNPVRITVALDKETNDLIEKMKDEMKVSQSELIRQVLRFYNENRILTDVSVKKRLNLYMDMLLSSEHVILDLDHWFLLLNLIESSPELKENQYAPFDFSIVSPLVDEIIENRRSKLELIEMGYLKNVVEDIYRRVRRAEYKRWQAPPCIKITRKAFGIGWKMPIVNKYKG